MNKAPLLPAATSALPPSFGADRPWLAPLAGYSDLPFRLLCRKYGAAVCCTEMISAAGLLHDNPGTRRLLQSVPDDAPLVVQLFGADPQSLSTAVHALADRGYYFFDCNMGCSVRKVMRQGAGAALLADPARALEIGKAMLQAIKAHNPSGMVGFKLRLGVDAQHTVLPELALRLEDIGASWITVHPRHASQGFGGDADWRTLEELARRLDIPLLASGDLLTGAKGVQCLAQTGVAGVMYARGALKNPAVFRDHLRCLAGGQSRAFSKRAMRELIELHLRLIEEHGTERAALLRMRTVAPRYAHSLPGASALRQDLCRCDNWQALKDALDRFTAEEEA